MLIAIGQTAWKIEQSFIMEDFGRTDPMSATITLNGTQQVDQYRDTLLHEVLHAIISAYGVPMGGPDSEEAILKTLTPALLDVLCDNPELITALTGKKWF